MISSVGGRRAVVVGCLLPPLSAGHRGLTDRLVRTGLVFPPCGFPVFWHTNLEHRVRSLSEPIAEGSRAPLRGEHSAKSAHFKTSAQCQTLQNYSRLQAGRLNINTAHLLNHENVLFLIYEVSVVCTTLVRTAQSKLSLDCFPRQISNKPRD